MNPNDQPKTNDGIDIFSIILIIMLTSPIWIAILCISSPKFADSVAEPYNPNEYPDPPVYTPMEH